MGKLLLNNEIVDRLAMLQHTEAGHPGINQVAIKKDWWVTVTLKAFQKEKPRSVRMSRHLYDLEKLMDTKYGKEALSNRELYNAIVEHRKTYYALKYVNYDLHSPSTISFTIPESVMEAWQDDYADMRRFFIYGESLEFDALMQKIRELQERVRVM